MIPIMSAGLKKNVTEGIEPKTSQLKCNHEASSMAHQSYPVSQVGELNVSGFKPRSSIGRSYVTKTGDLAGTIGQKEDINQALSNPIKSIFCSNQFY